MHTDCQKYFLILGGFIGFCLTLILGIYGGQDLLVNMLHATIGCIVGFVLTKLLLFVIHLHRTSEKEEGDHAQVSQKQEDHS